MNWLAQCRAWVERYDPVRPEMMQGDFHHYGAMRALSDYLPVNTTMIYDTGGNAIMSGHCFRTKAGQRVFSSNGATPMGFSMCAAIGAWYADPSRVIVCLIGDGGMSMNIQELEVIRRVGANIKVFIFNNEVLGNTLSYQRVNNKPQIACRPPDYTAPNFPKIAQAYGLMQWTIEKWSDFRMLDTIVSSPLPWIVDVRHVDFCDYAPRLSRWDCGIDEMHPQLPENEFLSNMMIEPLAGWRERRE